MPDDKWREKTKLDLNIRPNWDRENAASEAHKLSLESCN